MVARGERHAPAQAERAGSLTKRAFSGDVDRFGTKLDHAAFDIAFGKRRKSNVGIGGQRHCPIAVRWRDHFNCVAAFFKNGYGGVEGSNDPVHLRVPRICHEKDFHERFPLAL